MSFFKENGLAMQLAIQGALGVPIAANAFSDIDGIAGFDPSWDIVNTSDTVKYADAVNSKDEFYSIKEREQTWTSSTYLPGFADYASLTGTDPATDANFNTAIMFKLAGATVTYEATAQHTIMVSTETGLANTVGTMVVTEWKKDDIAVEKCYRAFNTRAMVDLDFTIGERAKLTWTFKGVPVESLEPSEAYPEERAYIGADYRTQKTAIAPVLRAAQFNQAQFVPYVTGDDLPTPFTGTIKTFCIQKITATNLFGLELVRLQTTCSDEYEQQEIATDVVVTIMEEALDPALPQPDALQGVSVYSEAMLERNFQFGLQWGDTAGKRYYLEWTKLQLTNSKPTVVEGQLARELTFRNCGYVTYMLR